MISEKYSKLGASFKTKPTSKHSIILGLGLFTSLSFFNINALPQGGSVASGQATIESSPGYMQINQQSNQAVIDWQSFNIGASEHTHFNQPSASSLTINRVNAANGSSAIFGKLTATGQIFLLNPAGVIFGPTAQVNVGSILASTSDLNFEAYKLGKIELLPNPDYTGSIINHAKIKVSDGGYAAFVSPNVVNNGIITAKLGHVQLSSGEYFTVDLYGDDLIHFKVPEHKLNSKVKDYKVSHTGEIYANGGSIAITTADAKDIVSSVINMDGLMQANSVQSNKGKIVLSSNGNSTINFGNSSKIFADSGYVKVSAKNINLTSNSLIDVSSKTNGNNAGEIYIGGNYQGKLVSEKDFNAKNVYVAPNAKLLANAKQVGDGGKVIVWSDDTTKVAGVLEANSGTESGDGGLIETSGKVNLDILSDIQVSAASLNGLGKQGEWLLDPVFLLVDNNLALNIKAVLDTSTNVTISTDQSAGSVINQDTSNNLTGGSATTGGANDGDIFFDNPNEQIAWDTTASFTAKADNNILFSIDSLGLDSSGGGDIKLYAGLSPTSSTDGDKRGMVYKSDMNSNLPVASSNGGLIEIYIRPEFASFSLPSLHSFPDNLSSGSAGTSNFTSDHTAIFNVSTGSQFIEYHWINYNDPDPLFTDRTLSTAAFLASGASGPLDPVIGFALFDNVTLPSDDPPFLGFNNFSGHFDGNNKTISGLNLTGLETTGFFNNTISQPILPDTPEFPYLNQYIKNINFTNSFIEVNSVTPTLPSNAGILIGTAEIDSSAPLNISNIRITDGQVNSVSDGLGGPILGKSGGVIGASIPVGQPAPGVQSILNLHNINVEGVTINSSHVAGGVVGDMANSNTNLSGGISLNAVTVSSQLKNPITGIPEDATPGVYSAGLFGVTSNPNFILESNSPITIGASISAENQVPNGNAFSGGLIADFIGSELKFGSDTIAVFGDSLSATIPSYSTTPSGSSLRGDTFAAGLIATAHNDPSLGNPPANAEFNGEIIIDSQPVATVNLDNQQGNFDATSGGLFGQVEFNNVTFNNQIKISSIPVAKVNTPTNPVQSEIRAGGLSGSESITTLIYNANISTNGAIATANQGQTINGSADADVFAGGLAGFMENTSTTFSNGTTVTIENNATTSGDTGRVLAEANSNEATSLAGGLYGLALGNPSANSVTINANIDIRADVEAKTNGTAVNISDPAFKYFAGVYAGGAFGLASGVNTTINSQVLINSSMVSAETDNAPTGEAIQAAGGLFGGLVNADFIFDDSLFDFTNASTTTSNHGASAGVIGHIDIQEENPTTTAGITNGVLTLDELNDGLDWDAGASNFDYTNADPCQGPSAALCTAATNGDGTGDNTGGDHEDPEETASNEVTHTSSDQNTAHGDGSGGHNNAHAKHAEHGGHAEHDPHFYHGHEHEHPFQLLSHSKAGKTWLHNWLHTLNSIEINKEGEPSQGEQEYSPNTFHYSPEGKDGHHESKQHGGGH